MTDFGIRIPYKYKKAQRNAFDWRMVYVSVILIPTIWILIISQLFSTRESKIRRFSVSQFKNRFQGKYNGIMLMGNFSSLRYKLGIWNKLIQVFFYWVIIKINITKIRSKLIRCNEYVSIVQDRLRKKWPSQDKYYLVLKHVAKKIFWAVL